MPADHAADRFTQLRVVGEIEGQHAFAIAAETIQAVHHVGRVTDFALLAVARDIDADVGLLFYHRADRAGDYFCVFAAIVDFTLVPFEKDFGEFRGPRQAADVSRENAPSRCFQAVFSRNGTGFFAIAYISLTAGRSIILLCQSRHFGVLSWFTVST